MPFKDLLTLLVGPDDVASRYAIRLAAACGATLTVAIPVIEPDLPPYVIAQAVGDALPLIQLANLVQIVTVEDDDEESKKRRVSPEKLARHLRRYGIATEPKRLIADIEVAAQLLSHVADESADFVVMGGYGHSRLREMVLGGRTLEILRSMTAPLLMAH